MCIDWSSALRLIIAREHGFIVLSPSVTGVIVLCTVVPFSPEAAVTDSRWRSLKLSLHVLTIIM